MKNKILLIIICILLPISIFVSFKKIENKTSNKQPIKKLKVKTDILLKLTKSNEIISLDLEDYILGVIAAEMPAAFDKEALKAQAVASRSYALSKIGENKEYDFDDTIAYQAYINIEQMQEKWQDDFERYYNKLKEVIEETRGLVMTYNNEIITAFYFSMSNGYTENAALVFNEDLPYLESVESNWESNASTFSYVSTITYNEFCTALNIDCNNGIKINNIIRSDSNRILTLSINDKVFKGTEIRTKLNLRSTDFTINIQSAEIEIITKGYGHGVGMSQYGANGMAKEGKLFNEILNHYYKNINITKI